MTYRPAGDAAGERRYRLLAAMLASLIDGIMPEPASAATTAGREWGSFLAEQPAPYQRTSGAEALARLTAIMTSLGFDPQPGAEGAKPTLGLRHCPFKEIARDHPDVVCSLHLGLMRGALTKLRAPISAESLEPFAGPGLCIVHITGEV